MPVDGAAGRNSGAGVVDLPAQREGVGVEGDARDRRGAEPRRKLKHGAGRSDMEG